MKKKILFFSSILPDDSFYKNSIGQTSTANDTLQRAIMKGFEENGYKVDIINIPNIGAYPMRYKRNRVNSVKVYITEGIKGDSIGFINLPLIKHKFIYAQLKKLIKSYNISQYNAIFVYDSYIPFLNILKYIKKKYSIKTILYLPDLIGQIGNPDNMIHSYLNKVAKKRFTETLSYIDIIVLIAEGMKEHINVSNNECVVIEGMWDGNCAQPVKNKSPENRYIFYGGSLGRRHGILNLIEAFNKANLKDMYLVICGDGDTRDEIQQFAISNPNIKFMGQIPRNKILELQANAFLLVNPRGSCGEFTKYSFPSKVFEYFTSGTATFMYKLPGIPAEYYEYCFSSDDESVDALAEKLKLIDDKNVCELNELGKKAREFVVQNKNSKKQINKLIHLID